MVAVLRMEPDVRDPSCMYKKKEKRQQLVIGIIDNHLFNNMESEMRPGRIDSV